MDPRPSDPDERRSRRFPAQFATRDIFRNGSGFVKIFLAIKGPVGKVAVTVQTPSRQRARTRERDASE